MSEDKATFTTDDTKGAKQAAEAALAAAGELPESGAARQKELAAKAERLIEAAAKLLDQMDISPADDGSLQADREIRAALNEMNEVYVSNAQSDYAYSWIYRDPTNEFGGRYVRRMQALGWELVTKEMPEARERPLHVDNTRVVADCLLMRIRLDRQLLLEKRDRLLREAQQAGISARVSDLAERAGTRVLDTSEIMGMQGETVSNHATANRRANARTRFHQMNVGGRMDAMLKTGRIPGVPSPGRVR